MKAGVGSSFDDFLKEEGTYEVTEVIAIKRLLAWEIKRHLIRSETERRIKTTIARNDGTR